MKDNLKIIIIVSIAAVVILGTGIVISLSSGLKYNDDDAVGNTTGNLHNGGMVCESGGYVYIADPTNNNKLYKMKPDGSKAEVISGDNVSYINVYGNYIYYKRHNYKSGVNELFKGNLYGIYRIKTNGKQIEELHRGIVGSIALLGNTLYYQNFDGNMYSLYKVKIDGKNDKKISDTGYVPACVFDGKVYFAEINEHHNLMSLNPENDRISTFSEGNMYLPDIYDGYVYYIDADNNRALTKKSIATGEKTVISGEDRVINYNMCGDKDVIFYQAENGTEHKLMKTDLSGKFSQVVAEGDFTNISITSKYTYFVKIFDDDKTLYRTPTEGIADPEIYIIKTGK